MPSLGFTHYQPAQLTTVGKCATGLARLVMSLASNPAMTTAGQWRKKTS